MSGTDLENEGGKRKGGREQFVIVGVCILVHRGTFNRFIMIIEFVVTFNFISERGV